MKPQTARGVAVSQARYSKEDISQMAASAAEITNSAAKTLGLKGEFESDFKVHQFSQIFYALMAGKE